MSIASHVFLGAAITATSVGITARVLKDSGSLEERRGENHPLGAAVADDVLCSCSAAWGRSRREQRFSRHLVIVALRATAGFLVLAVALERELIWFSQAARLRTGGALLAVGLCFCFLLSWRPARLVSRLSLVRSPRAWCWRTRTRRFSFSGESVTRRAAAAHDVVSRPRLLRAGGLPTAPLPGLASRLFWCWRSRSASPPSPASCPARSASWDRRANRLHPSPPAPSRGRSHPRVRGVGVARSAGADPGRLRRHGARERGDRGQRAPATPLVLKRAASAAGPDRACCGSVRRILVPLWKRVGVAVDVDVAGVRGDDLPNHRQPEADAGLIRADAEQRAKLVGGNPAPSSYSIMISCRPAES